jgi:MFS family permease
VSLLNKLQYTRADQSELAAAVGALMAGPISDIYSRKYSISGWTVVFILGVAIQTGANFNVATMYAGRWFAGMGVGALSMLVPMYNAELAPPGIRGSLVALQQLAITFGILVSYWIAYGTNCTFIQSLSCVHTNYQTSVALSSIATLELGRALLLGGFP